jgi:hypothetical protein
LVPAGEFDGDHHIGNQERVLQKQPSDSIPLRPVEPVIGERKRSLQPASSFIPEPVGNAAGAAVMVVINLTARTFQVSVMVKQLEPPQRLLPAAVEQGSKMV